MQLFFLMIFFIYQTVIYRLYRSMLVGPYTLVGKQQSFSPCELSESMLGCELSESMLGCELSESMLGWELSESLLGCELSDSMLGCELSDSMMGYINGCTLKQEGLLIQTSPCTSLMCLYITLLQESLLLGGQGELNDVHFYHAWWKMSVLTIIYYRPYIVNWCSICKANCYCTLPWLWCWEEFSLLIRNIDTFNERP